MQTAISAAINPRNFIFDLKSEKINIIYLDDYANAGRSCSEQMNLIIQEKTWET